DRRRRAGRGGRRRRGRRRNARGRGRPGGGRGWCGRTRPPAPPPRLGGPGQGKPRDRARTGREAPFGMSHAIIVAAVCFVAGVALYPVLITILARAGAGQMVQAYNPSTHRAKAGTPTMGGILFCLIAVAVWLGPHRPPGRLVVGLAPVGGAGGGGLARPAPAPRR